MSPQQVKWLGRGQLAFLVGLGLWLTIESGLNLFLGLLSYGFEVFNEPIGWQVLGTFIMSDAVLLALLFSRRASALILTALLLLLSLSVLVVKFPEVGITYSFSVGFGDTTVVKASYTVWKYILLWFFAVLVTYTIFRPDDLDREIGK